MLHNQQEERYNIPHATLSGSAREIQNDFFPHHAAKIHQGKQSQELLRLITVWPQYSPLQNQNSTIVVVIK